MGDGAGGARGRCLAGAAVFAFVPLFFAFVSALCFAGHALSIAVPASLSDAGFLGYRQGGRIGRRGFGFGSGVGGARPFVVRAWFRGESA